MESKNYFSTFMRTPSVGNEWSTKLNLTLEPLFKGTGHQLAIILKLIFSIKTYMETINGELFIHVV